MHRVCSSLPVLLPPPAASFSRCLLLLPPPASCLFLPLSASSPPASSCHCNPPAHNPAALQPFSPQLHPTITLHRFPTQCSKCECAHPSPCDASRPALPGHPRSRQRTLQHFHTYHEVPLDPILLLLVRHPYLRVQQHATNDHPRRQQRERVQQRVDVILHHETAGEGGWWDRRIQCAHPWCEHGSTKHQAPEEEHMAVPAPHSVSRTIPSSFRHPTRAPGPPADQPYCQEDASKDLCFKRQACVQGPSKQHQTTSRRSRRSLSVPTCFALIAATPFCPLLGPRPSRSPPCEVSPLPPCVAPS